MQTHKTTSDAAPAVPALFRGSIVGVDDAGQPVVAWGEGRTASAAVIHMEQLPVWSRCSGISVFLAFENGDETQPVIMGFLEAPPRATSAPDVVRIESGKEMIFECGKAKIALRADGRIEIRGGHLISRSSGPNKIKGGSVFIN